ncbi:TolC family protein [Hydrogenophaga sp. XSHU_21]
MLVFAGWVSVVPSAVADKPLSLRAAVSAAAARSRSLDAATTAALGAREMAVAAAQRPDPVLRLSLDNLPVDGPDRFSTTRDFMTMRSIALMQTLPSADKRRALGERFEREAEVALSERNRRQALLQTEVAQAWLERRMQEQRFELLQAQIAEARVLVQTTEAVLRSGRSTPAEVFSAREALAQLEQGLIGAKAERDNARLTLARFTGGAPDQPLADPPPMRTSTASIPNADQWPEINAMKAREAAARAEAEVARQELKPDWSAEIMFSQRGSGFSNMVSIGVSVPLQWDRPQRQQRELTARLARVNELQAEREELTRERALQVLRWQQAWRAGLERLAFLDAQRQPLATQRVDAALAAYRGGREGLGAVLQARRDALNLALERIALERETAGLWAQLEYLIPDTTDGVKP